MAFHVLPTVHHTINSPFTQHELTVHLKRVTTTSRTAMVKRKADALPFIGAVRGGTFQLQRPTFTWFRKDAYAPRIRGRILPSDTGSTIQLEFRPSTAAYAGLILLLIFTTFTTIVILDGMLSREPIACVAVFPYIAVTIFYVILRMLHLSAIARDKQAVTLLLTNPKPIA
jgi:hypothetical protein